MGCSHPHLSHKNVSRKVGKEFKEKNCLWVKNATQNRSARDKNVTIKPGKK